MKVLSVASECAPLVKTGGLADVVGALPGALAPLGVALRTLLPGYPVVMATLSKAKPVWSDPNLFGGPARVIAGHVAGLDLLILDAPHLFARAGGPYADPAGADWPDNPERFAALSWVAAQIAGGALPGWRPDILHAHDWQAGLAPWYLRESHPDAAVGTVLTIHNIAFQGKAGADRLAALRLAPAGMTQDGFEFWGDISALKAAGINVIATAKGESADVVSRFFAPASGVDEDPVTGSAHATLAPYWAQRLGRHHLTARQIGPRPGALEMTVAGNGRVTLTGTARRYLDGVVRV
jgi:glycogen synthase